MKATQEQVNKMLINIKKTYPDSNNNGLDSYISASSDTPLYYMDNDDFLGQVIRSQEWVKWAKTFGLRKTINKNMSSYGIKHNIEVSEISKGYVCNMAAIVALLIEGVTINADGNPKTNLSSKIHKEHY